MLVSFFEREKGGLDYVLRDQTAEVIRGNPRITQGLVDTIRGRQRYTAGVITEDSGLSDETRNQAIDGLNHQLYAGLPPCSLSGVYTRHTGKGRDETHFNFANLELVTGKPYSPFVDRIDRHRFSACQESFNLTHGLPDPSSRLRVQPDYSKSRLSKTDRDFLMNIWHLVDWQVSGGLVTNRRELVAYLRTIGYNVREVTHAGAELEQIVVYRNDGKALRLKGSIYYRKDFDTSMLTPKKEPTAEAIATRIKELQQTIDKGLEFRAFHTIGRLFGRGAQKDIASGFASSHLRALMAQKRIAWELPAPVHPMWSERGIHDLVRLIEVTATQSEAASVIGHRPVDARSSGSEIISPKPGPKPVERREEPTSLQPQVAIPAMPTLVRENPPQPVLNRAAAAEKPATAAAPPANNNALSTISAPKNTRPPLKRKTPSSKRLTKLKRPPTKAPGGPTIC